MSTPSGLRELSRRRFPFAAALGALTLAGTAARLAWALKARPWESAADQVAWELLLSEGRATGLRWDQLVHYPHDAGGIVLSLLALAIGPVGTLPSLAAATLLLDTLLRGAALLLAASAFDRRTALWLGAFWLLPLPVLLPFSVIGFLHALAAIWTIVLVSVARKDLEKPHGPALLGAAAGLAIATSFDGLVLLPAALVLALYDAKSRGPRRLALFAAALAAPLLLLLVARSGLDLGFAGLDPFTIRGVALTAHPLPAPGAIREWALGISQLPGVGTVPPRTVRQAWSLLALAGLAWAAMRRERGTGAGLGVLVTFAAAYLAGPFFDPRAADPMAYRYAAYVLPLLALLVFRGFGTRWGTIAAAAFVAIGWLGAITEMRAARPGVPADRGAGWVLARKLGDDPARLARISDLAPAARRGEIFFGYGWGIAAARLEGKAPSAPEALAAIARLRAAAGTGGLEKIDEGIRFAFAPGVTPRLDPRFLPLLTAPRPAAP